jgi:hypothetical protein
MKTAMPPAIASLWLVVLITALCGGAIGCASARLPAVATSDPAGTGEVVLARYGGRLPCADCEAIRIELTLYCAGVRGAPTRYESHETYLGTRDGDREFRNTGRWTILRGTPNDPRATVYQLDFDNPERARSFLKLDENELTALDRSLNELPSQVPRTLMRFEEGAATR